MSRLIETAVLAVGVALALLGWLLVSVLALPGES